MLDECKRRLWARLSGGTLGFDIDWIDDSLVLREDGPDWFRGNGNLLVAPVAAALPVIAHHDGLPYPTDGLLVFGQSAHVSKVTIWGSGSVIAMARSTHLPAGSIACGDGAFVYLGENTFASFSAALNARNGGLIHVEGDGLWSIGIRIFTDDMHAIRDAVTGARVNTFGGKVLVHSHVWLGLEVLLLGGADVGQDSIVGARAVVTGALPPNAVSVGTPARPIRRGVTWTREDAP